MTTFISSTKSRIPAHKYRRYSELLIARDQRIQKRKERCDRIKDLSALFAFTIGLGAMIVMLRHHFL